MHRIELELIASLVPIFIIRCMNDNKLPIEIRASKSIAEFKRKLITLIRLVKNTIYEVSDLKGIIGI